MRKTAEEIIQNRVLWQAASENDRFNILECMELYASQDKWIAVEEQTPEDGQIVDTWNGIENRRAIYHDGIYERHIYPVAVERIIVATYPDVTHWQPLPSPPHE